MKPFSIVLVTFNSAEVLGAALRSIPVGHQVIVVDNASGDDSVSVARDLGAKVVKLSENFGFGTACNRGAERAIHDRLLFLNPDAIPDADSLDILSRAFETYPNSAAFNPRLIEAHGRQFFRRRNAVLPRHYWRRPPVPTRNCKVVMLSGAALAIRKVAFEHVGGFDENIFLYFEDDDLSARLVKAGYELHYIHDAVVRHTLGRSSPPSRDMTMFREYHAMKAKEYVMKKHGLAFYRPMRRIQEWFRAKFGKPGSERQLRAEARSKALRE